MSCTTELTVVSESVVRTFRSQQSAVVEIDGVRVHVCVKGEQGHAIPLKNAPAKCKSIHGLARCLRELCKEHSQNILHAEVQEHFGYTFSMLAIFSREMLFGEYKAAVEGKPEAALHPILVIYVYDKTPPAR
jgi:hypothetical protein